MLSHRNAAGRAVVRYNQLPAKGLSGAAGGRRTPGKSLTEIFRSWFERGTSSSICTAPVLSLLLLQCPQVPAKPGDPLS